MLFFAAMMVSAKRAVYMAKRARPESIRMMLSILPASVTGVIFPYPVVVAVVNPHQIASIYLFTYGFTPCSRCQKMEQQISIKQLPTRVITRNIGVFRRRLNSLAKSPKCGRICFISNLIKLIQITFCDLRGHV